MIRLKNVSKFYYSKGMIASGFSKVNLELNVGEFVVITGESGSGKSTLLNVISGLDSYEEGELYIDDKETSHYLTADFELYRKKYIGNIFQSFNLINSYTVYQNIETILLINGYEKEQVKEKVRAIVEKVGLTEHIDTKASKLSGGQKQRVSIARALAKETSIIVADEPTGNLDSKSAEEIVALLSVISKDKLVIVVTHNYEQFEQHATRKIKMHDGKIMEDKEIIKVAKNILPKENTCEPISKKSIVRLGVRNTFNIVPKFVLLLVVILFLILAAFAQYTTLQKQEEEMGRLGYNPFFENYSEKRIVFNKKDKTEITAEELEKIKKVEFVDTLAKDDAILDQIVSLVNNNMDVWGFTKSTDSLGGKVDVGRLPENSQEAVVEGGEGDYLLSKKEELLGKKFEASAVATEGANVPIGEVTIVGIKYNDATHNYMYDFYLADEYLNILKKSAYLKYSKVKATIDGKTPSAATGGAPIVIGTSPKVKQGQAIIPEEYGMDFTNGTAKSRKLALFIEHTYYKDNTELKIADVFSKKTFTSKTGKKDYDMAGSTIYISEEDYNSLFLKGDYQASVMVNNGDNVKAVAAELEKMGYKTFPLVDSITVPEMEVIKIIQVPFAVIMVLAVFFIAYFVIRLILKSRGTYFAILRMLGLPKLSTRRILDVEMFLVLNIAFGIFVALLGIVRLGIVDIPFLYSLTNYVSPLGYVFLYVVLSGMIYLISGKFAKAMFKKSALEAHREEA